MRFQARDLGHILDPRITTLVHDAEGPAGVILCIPDFNPMLRDMRSRLTLAAPWHLLKYRLRAVGQCWCSRRSSRGSRRGD